MRIYETTFIINPQTDDNSIDSSVKSISTIISNNGCKILHEDRMGTRRLAYEIKGMTQGYYANIIFEGETTILPLLKEHFRLGEAYLRNLTVQFEGSLEDLTRSRDRDDDRDNDDRGPRDRREPARPAAPEPKEEPKKEETAQAEPAEEESDDSDSTDDGDAADESANETEDEEDKEL